MKRGFATPGAEQYTGRVHVLDIGAPRRLVEEVIGRNGIHFRWRARSRRVPTPGPSAPTGRPDGEVPRSVPVSCWRECGCGPGRPNAGPSRRRPEACTSPGGGGMASVGPAPGRAEAVCRAGLVVRRPELRPRSTSARSGRLPRTNSSDKRSPGLRPLRMAESSLRRVDLAARRGDDQILGLQAGAIGRSTVADAQDPHAATGIVVGKGAKIDPRAGSRHDRRTVGSANARFQAVQFALCGRGRRSSQPCRQQHHDPDTPNLFHVPPTFPERFTIAYDGRQRDRHAAAMHLYASETPCSIPPPRALPSFRPIRRILVSASSWEGSNHPRFAQQVAMLRAWVQRQPLSGYRMWGAFRAEKLTGVDSHPDATGTDRRRLAAAACGWRAARDGPRIASCRPGTSSAAWNSHGPGPLADCGGGGCRIAAGRRLSARVRPALPGLPGR